MTTQHTPTPWEMERDHQGDGTPYEGGGHWYVYGGEEQAGIELGPMDKAHAAYICKAVNSHAALVEALESIEAHDEFTGGEPGSPIAQAYAILNALRLKARAALKLAKES